jgi:hypothetical protein
MLGRIVSSRFFKISMIAFAVLSMVSGLIVQFLRWMDGYYFFIGGLILLFLSNSFRKRR